MLTGGKFGNAAQTAALAHLLNAETSADEARRAGAKDKRAQKRGECNGRPCIDRSGGPMSAEDVLAAIETIGTASDVATGLALGVDVVLGGPTGEGILAAGGITLVKKRLINNAMDVLSDYLGAEPKSYYK